MMKVRLILWWILGGLGWLVERADTGLIGVENNTSARNLLIEIPPGMGSLLCPVMEELVRCLSNL